MFKDICKDMFKLAVHVGIVAQINKVVDDLEDCGGKNKRGKIEEGKKKEHMCSFMLRSGLRCHILNQTKPPEHTT